jgi:hypothetical protein
MAPSHRHNPRYDTSGCVINVLAICGSLRRASINAALLRAAARLSPPEMRVGRLSGIGELPLFNPDFEHHRPVPVPLLGAHLTKDEMVEDPTISRSIRGALEALYSCVVLRKYEHCPVIEG